MEGEEIIQIPKPSGSPFTVPHLISGLCENSDICYNETPQPLVILKDPFRAHHFEEAFPDATFPHR